MVCSQASRNIVTVGIKTMILKDRHYKYKKRLFSKETFEACILNSFTFGGVMQNQMCQVWMFLLKHAEA